MTPFDGITVPITPQVSIGEKTMAAPKTIRLYDEISVFNQIIRDDSQIHKLRQCIDPYSVSIKRHRILRQAIAQLYDLKHPVDLVNLSWYLADHALLDEVGGFRYLQYIAGFHNSNASISSRDLHLSGKVETAS